MRILSWLWQFPQELLGLLFGCFLKGKRRLTGVPGIPQGICVRFSESMSGGISLGHFVYVRRIDDIRMVRHEYGHCRQSLILGPLYLAVIGLPSLLWAVWWNPCRRVPYYRFYTERWADRLGGVVR